MSISSAGQKASRVIMILLAVVVLAIAASVAGALYPAPTVDGSATRLEAAGDLGSDPFAPDLRLIAETAPADTPGIASAQIDGRLPGVWQPAPEACDKAELLTTLQSDDVRSAAWRSVFSLAQADLTEFIDRLEPVTLAQDSAVMNHGYSNGNAEPVRTILQAGTIVLVDGFGVPRVLCKCGNPLLTTISVGMEQPVGDPWPNFDSKRVIALVPVDAPPPPPLPTTAPVVPTTVPPTLVPPTPTPLPVVPAATAPTVAPTSTATPTPLPRSTVTPTATPVPAPTPTPTPTTVPLRIACTVSPRQIGVETPFTVTVSWVPATTLLNVVISIGAEDWDQGGSRSPVQEGRGRFVSQQAFDQGISYFATGNNFVQGGRCDFTQISGPPDCPADRQLSNGECCPTGRTVATDVAGQEICSDA